MLDKLKVYWQHLVTKEKALWKSATMWVAGTIAALPDIADYAQAHFPDIAPLIPPAFHDRAMHWIAAAVAVARLKSLVKLPKVPPAAVVLVALMLLPLAGHAAIDPNCPIAKAPVVVTLNWTAPANQASTPPSPLAANQLPLSFNVFMSTVKGGEAAPALLSALSGTTTTLSNALQANTSYYFTMTAVDALGQQSAMTNEVCVSTPPFPPSTFTITVTAT